MQVDISAQTEADARAAFLWYHERSPLAADAFRAEVLDAIDALSVDAAMWPKDEDGLRYRVLSRFPYTIHYEFEASTVTVLAVAHQRRRPGYWRRPAR